jgi:sugar/nucleoside kinase (ribokinase family)
VICTLGDMLLDVVVRLDGPIVEDTDSYGRTRAGAGGQASNVAAWVVALGGRARFIGKRASDPAGRLVAEQVGALGVELVGPVVEEGTGTVVSIATPDGRRTMLTDRGVSPQLTADEVDPAWVDGCEWLHVPGYSLARTPIREAALAAAARAARVSLDVSSTAAVEEVGVDRFRELVDELRPEVVFANEDEAAQVGRLDGLVVEKLGSRGFRADGREHSARHARVVDSTGAGDAFAAGYLLGGPELALEAAARCVERMGALP